MSDLTDELYDCWPEDDGPDLGVICERCGADDGLEWERDQHGKWFLVDPDGGIHECPPIDPMEFPLV